MAYYHVVIEAVENLGKNEEERDITLFDITELQSIIPHIIRPYLRRDSLIIEDERIDFDAIELFAIKQTLRPIQELIEEEQRTLPSNTDITISAMEIFNDRDLSQDVTQVIIDLLDD